MIKFNLNPAYLEKQIKVKRVKVEKVKKTTVRKHKILPVKFNLIPVQ